MNVVLHDISVAAEDLPPLPILESRWCALEARAGGSFFTSWMWIGAWLATGESRRRCLITACRGGKTIGLAVFGRAQRRMAGVLPHATLALHQDGDATDDALFIEYNGILADHAAAQEVREAILAFVEGSDWFAHHPWAWDELRLAGLAVDAIGAPQIPGLRRQTLSRACAWVDLAQLGPDASLDTYLATLSRNTRQQVRRALRLAEIPGALKITRAETAADKQAYLAILKELHQEYWRKTKHQPGAFAAPAFREVVAHLIAAPVPERCADTRAPEGAGTQVELLQIAAGETTVGVLLNFVHRGHVYAYQSGFAYRDDNRFKPGLLSHALAIVDAAQRGRTAYHFMAGDSRYKSSLGTSNETLAWLTFSRRHPLTTVMDGLRGAKSFLQAITAEKR